MTPDPLVSIVLPTYNGARYLAQAIASCQRQTYPSWELILVDDASTDDTPALIAEAARRDGRIRSLRNATNRKLPAALNAGFAQARGAYLTWTSDDNLYEPDALEVMAGHLEAHPGTGLVYCDMRKIGADGEDLGPYRLRPPAALPRRNWVGGCFLYRRAVYEAVGDYATDLFLAEDYDYWLRVARRFRLDYLAGAAPYRYRVHPTSLTRTRQAQIRIQTARAQCRHVVPAARRRQVLAAAYWDAGWAFRQAKDLKSARRCLLQCLWLKPTRFLYWKGLLGALGQGMRGE
jgi:glycosyltransferase involved in cell wall biosynthesis